MLNFAGGNIQVPNWTVLNPLTICYFYTPRVINASTNRHLGTADNFESKSTASDGKYKTDIFDNTGETATTGPIIGTRVHIAFCGQRNANIKTYINGILEATDNTVTATPTSPAELDLGNRHPQPAAEAANGDMEDIRTYNRILSANEIKTIYNANGRDNIREGLLNRWIVTTLGDGSEIDGATIYDLGPNKQNATKEIYTPDRTVYFRPGLLNPRRMV